MTIFTGINDVPTLKRHLAQAKEALRGLYNLKEGLAKPLEHKPTRDALREAELVLFGTFQTPDEGNK